MTAPEQQGPKAAIRAHALALGFDAVGFAKAEVSPEARAGLAAFLAAGYHGEMDWLARHAERRADPRVLWPEARSVVVLGQNYGPRENPLALLDQPQRAAVSVYARNADYHDLMKKRLKALARWMHQDLGAEVKVFVDTAPVMEKHLAQAGGLGWQGKHSNLVSCDLGSWLFLGEVYTTLALAPDARERDHCGTCRRCLDVCPTDAFPAPYQLDARRCISYLTIEHKSHIPRAFRAAMGNRIYGCDDCLAVCPWNKYAQPTGDDAFLPRAALDGPRLAKLAQLDDAGFRGMFRGSPVKRTGRDRFVRNVLIALGNSRDSRYVRVVESLLDDDSPLVRAMAVWALSCLTTERKFQQARARRLPDERNPKVRTEWQAPPA